MDRASKVQEVVISHVQDHDTWHIGNFVIELPGPLTLHGAMALIALGILALLFIFLFDKKAKVPTGITNFLEPIVLFVRDEISIAYLGEEDGRKLCPFFLTLFFWILTMNLMGLFPIFATATANINVTLALALLVFIVMNIGAIAKNNFKGYINAFAPSGVPMAILPVIFFLELLGGLIIKPGVLALRLMANMLAGHIALFSIIGLILTFGAAKAGMASLLALFVYMLEILVSFLQAYIFTMLSAMFIGQVYHPEH